MKVLILTCFFLHILLSYTYSQQKFIEPEKIIGNPAKEKQIEGIIKRKDNSFLIKYLKGNNAYLVKNKKTSEEFYFDNYSKSIKGYKYSVSTNLSNFQKICGETSTDYNTATLLAME